MSDPNTFQQQMAAMMGHAGASSANTYKEIPVVVGQTVLVTETRPYCTGTVRRLSQRYEGPGIDYVEVEYIGRFGRVKTDWISKHNISPIKDAE
jgi:hypothetical protein